MKSNVKHVALSEIRRQLWSGHASVMIGSGFSRNADRASSTIAYPPDWNELGRGFVDRLYPNVNENEKNAVLGSKNVLQLAQEFEAAFQRPALNQYIKELICDENLIPNDLFSRLLELPWNDVFTTNYDTLLERASKTVVSQKYDVVYSCKDLAFSDAPRIIKLHGSFPSEATPLIVTEEDYRTYPVRYSPFVNTVQQTLMESVLCLIGFSGTDPNFLKWIGWVRDNLGKSMPSIYLIGFMDLTDAERRVLEAKKIIPVDLSEFRGGNKQCGYSDALSNAFKFLEERPDFVEWNPVEIEDISKLTQEQLVELIKRLERNRISYPNWIVMPLRRQNQMFHSTDSAMRAVQVFENLPTPWDIKGLYELNWRCEHCLMPLLNSAVPTFRKIIQRYNPYSTTTQFDRGLKDKWRDLVFAIYRWCREELQIQERQELGAILEKFCRDDLEAQNRLCFESVMWSFALSDVKSLDESMMRWGKLDRSPLWDVRFSAFLCETGQVEKATQIYENVLAQIRPSIPKGKIKKDYYLLSLEGIVLTALHNAHAAIRYRKSSTITSGFGLECSQRLETLAAMYCDPNILMSRFALLMSAPERREIGEVKTREFDMITRSWRMACGWTQDCKNAYQLARFTEEISIPLYTDNFTNELTTAVPGCVRRLVGYSAGWAFSLYSRIGRTNDVTEEAFISQRKEAALPSAQVDELVARYCAQIKHLIKERPDKLSVQSTSVHRRMAMVMFEILSRLTAKASQKSLVLLLELGMTIEASAIEGYDITFNNIYSSFYPRVIRAMRPKTLLDQLENLLVVGVPPKSLYRRWWHSSLMSVEWRGLKCRAQNCPPGVLEKVDSTIKSLRSEDRVERTAALMSFNKCMELGICTEQQKTMASRNLCEHTGEDGLPDVGRFYKHAYLEFLRPSVSRRKIENAIVRSYMKFDFESLLEADVKNNRCNYMSRIEEFAGSILATSSWVHALPQNQIRLSANDCWSLWEAFRRGFDVSLERARSVPKIEWNMSSDLQARMSADVYYYDRILSEVIIPGVTAKGKAVIAKWLVDVHDSGSFLCSRLVLGLLAKKVDEELKLDIMSSFSDGDSNVLADAFRAVYIWCELFAKEKVSVSPDLILYDMVKVIGMRVGRAFFDACETLGKVVHFVTLSETVETYVLRQLANLVHDTEYDYPSTRFENEDRGDYRAAAANLANQFYIVYTKKSGKIPDAIKSWKSICSSCEELDSVRRMWTEGNLTK